MGKEPDWDTIKNEVWDCAEKIGDYNYQQIIIRIENSTNPNEEDIEMVKDYWRGVVNWQK